MVESNRRRLAAIVSADVVGYSRLMGVDETATIAALRAHRKELIDPKIAEYGGRIVKTMGAGLSKNGLAWLRDLILSAVAKA